MNNLKRTSLSLLALLIFLCPLRVDAQYIPWQRQYRLKWDDFKGVPDKTSDFTAYTQWYYSYTASSAKGDSLKIVLDCSFDEQKSWKKPDKKLTPNLLLHEQLHFWIAELYARKMRQAFEQYSSMHTYKTRNKAEIAGIFERFNKECRTYSKLYDKETNHSKNEEKQEEWRKRIVKEVFELGAYEKK